MPIYEYRCLDCGREHEAIQKFSDPPMKECPGCGGRMEKLISSTSFVLKGGGWYKDGYSSGKAAGSSEGGKPSEKKAKAEGKPTPAPK